jgi:uncharacterized protein (DUF302 family)
MIGYGFVKELELGFDEAKKKVVDELKKEGFGVLSEIDVQAKFKEKLGVDFRRYVILGACNPPSAYKALQSEENIGLMLPCNVILYERNGGTAVGVIRPTVAMQMIENDQLRDIAREIERKLKRTLESL